MDVLLQNKNYKPVFGTTNRKSPSIVALVGLEYIDFHGTSRVNFSTFNQNIQIHI